MGYANDLVRLLRPLGFYSFEEGSFSLAQLQALGSELDEVEAYAQQKQLETLVPTAQNEGLDAFLRLFELSGAALGIEEKRAVIAALLAIGGDSFTLSALRACLAACGIGCVLDETQTVNCVQISFPGVMGVPEGFSWMQRVIERVLPCQLEIIYAFRYCTWGETMQYGLSWGNVSAMTWHAWRHYTQE